jgi:hypothetical protein
MIITKILLPVTATVLLLSTPVLAADWQPTYTPGQAVYIDPALAQSTKAPVLFAPELENQIKVLRDRSDINFVVVAVEAKNAPTNKPLGVAKADELIAYLGSQPGFPDNYALIAWARQAEDASKGGVGINLSPGQIKFDVKPFLKGRMPQNPKGAILTIAEQISSNKIAQANAVKAEEEFAAFASELGTVALNLLMVVLAIAGILALIKVLKPNFLYKKEAETFVEKWSNAVNNATDIHLELTSDEVIEFYSILAKSLESDQSSKLQGYLEKAKTEILQFLCIYDKCRIEGDSLNRFLENKQYRTILDLMGELNTYTVDFGKLPIEKASVFGGLNDIKKYQGIKLLNALDESMRRVIAAIAKVKYNKTTPENAVVNVYVEEKRREREKSKKELKLRRL